MKIGKFKSFTQKYLFYSVLFGVGMGLVFPLYAMLFVEFISPLHQVLFNSGCVLAGITVGLASFYIGKAIVVKNIGRLSVAMQALMNGEKANTDSLSMDSQDSIGQIARDFVRFNTGITDSMTRIKEVNTKLISLCFQLKKDSDELKDKYHSLLSHIEHLREDTQQIDLQNESNRSTADLVASTIAHTGVLTNETNDRIAETADAFSAIHEIVAEVASLVTKTNLLSINAAIESAHAGIYGKGFSIVAQEIKRQSELLIKFAGNISHVAQENITKVELATSVSRENSTNQKATSDTVNLMLENFRLQSNLTNKISVDLKQSAHQFSEIESISNKVSEVSETLELLASEFNDVLKFGV